MYYISCNIEVLKYMSVWLCFRLLINRCEDASREGRRSLQANQPLLHQRAAYTHTWMATETGNCETQNIT
jgi:hypothetical protein